MFPPIESCSVLLSRDSIEARSPKYKVVARLITVLTV